MQSYEQYWRSLPLAKHDKVHTTQEAKVSRKRSKHSMTLPVDPTSLPFDASRLPIFARKRIRRPITPPRTPDSGRSGLPGTPGRSPGNIQCPTPIPVSRFYGTPQTPSLASVNSNSSTSPSSQRLLTPTTPSNSAPGILKVRPFAVESPPSPQSYFSKQIRGSNESKQWLVREDTPSLSELRTEVRITDSHVAVSDIRVRGPTLLHHVSSSGGPLAALRRYDQAKRADSSLSGMSLFLNCPKKRVPFPSEIQLAKYQTIAAGWKKARNLGVGGGQGLKMIVHAVHTTNIGSRDSMVRFRSFISLLSEMKYAQLLGVDVLVFHPGATGQDGCDVDPDLDALADDLILLIEQIPKLTLAIENSTHRCRGQLGRSLAELEYLIKRVGPRLKVCLDLCHLHVDQYDLSSYHGRRNLIGDLDRLGWDNIAAVHVSDSMEVHGGTRDLHAGLGHGTIGLDGLREILRHPRLLGKVPYLLETPPCSAATGLHRHAGIERLESMRSRIEHESLRDILAIRDEDWEDLKFKARWWNEHRRRIKVIDRRIGRLAKKVRSTKENKLGWTPGQEILSRTRSKRLKRSLAMFAKSRFKMSTSVRSH